MAKRYIRAYIPPNGYDINREMREQLLEQIERQHLVCRYMNTKDRFIYLMQNDDLTLRPLITKFIVNCVNV